MKEFRIPAGGFKAFRKRAIQRILPLYMVLTLLMIGLGWYNGRNEANNATIMLAIIPFVLALVVFSVYRGINSKRAIIESLTIKVSDNTIVREQINTPTITLYFSDIIAITKAKDDSFIFTTKNPSENFSIPFVIEKYDELEALLSAIRLINDTGALPRSDKYKAFLSILTIPLMIAVYAVSNKFVVGICGTILICICLQSYFAVRRSKSIDNKTKRSLAWVFVMLASVLFVMFIKIFGISF